MTEQPLPLDTPKQPNPPPRPHWRDPQNIVAAANAILPEIIEWMGTDYFPRERERILEQLIDCIDSAFSTDGYHLTKYLEEHHLWECDSELVEILDGAFTYLLSENDKRVEAWASANGIKPTLAIGTRVKAQGIGEGTITGFKEDRAQYVVQTEEWLQQHPNQPMNCGYLIPYEHAEELSPA